MWIRLSVYDFDKLRANALGYTGTNIQVNQRFPNRTHTHVIFKYNFKCAHIYSAVSYHLTSPSAH